MSWFANLVGRKEQPKEQPKVPTQEMSFGYDVAKRNTVVEMNDMQKKMVKTTSKYISELDKYKEIQKFNKQLSKSYIANLNIIVDVSKILNMYMETIDVIRTQISRAEQALGKPLDAQELSYLSDMTKENIMQLSKKFFEETGKLQTMYSKNPEYKNESDKLNIARTNFESTMTQLTRETNPKLGSLLAANSGVASSSSQPQPQPPVKLYGGVSQIKKNKSNKKSNKKSNNKSKKTNNK